jgi:hypothetical protein
MLATLLWRPCAIARITLVLLATIGCGGGGGYGPGAFLAEYGKAICEKNFACCTADETAGRSRASCDLSWASAAGSFEARITRGESQGRLVFHAETAKACVLALQQATCATWPRSYTELDVCVTQAIEPKVSVGSPCQGGECAGSYCLGYTTTDYGRVIDGVCIATVALGEACTVIIDCGDTAACDPVTHTCVADRAPGEPCVSMLECASNSCTTPPGGNTSLCDPLQCYFNTSF